MAVVAETQQSFNPSLGTTQAIMLDKPRVPIVAHIITDDDIGILKVKKQHQFMDNFMYNECGNNLIEIFYKYQ